LCKCVDDYTSGVVIGAMNGKDCRANGEVYKLKNIFLNSF